MDLFNVRAAAIDIARAASSSFTPDEQHVIIDALARYRSFRGLTPAGVQEVVALCVADASQADILIEAALVAEAAPSQTIADIESIYVSDSESNWSQDIESISATSATGVAAAQVPKSRVITSAAPERGGLRPEKGTGAVADTPSATPPSRARSPVDGLPRVMTEVETGVADVADRANGGLSATDGLASATTENTTGGVADGDPSATPNSHAMPLADDLLYGEFQVWKNASKPKQAEWVIKVRVARSAEALDYGRLHEFYLGFVTESKDLRYRVGQQALKGRVSQEWAQYLCDISRTLEPGQIMAQVTKGMFAHGSTVPKGRSGKEREVFEQFAVLTLDPTRSSPVALDLYLSPGDPLRLTQVTPAAATRIDGKARSIKAAQWIAYYDPHGMAAMLKREAKALKRHVAQKRQLTQYHPVTVLGDVLEPFIMRIEILERQSARGDQAREGGAAPATDELHVSVKALAQQVADLRHELMTSRLSDERNAGRIDQLRREVEDLKARTVVSTETTHEMSLTRDEQLAKASRQAAELRSRSNIH